MITDAQIRKAMKEVTSEVVLTDGGAGRGTGSLRLVVRATTKGVTAQWFAAWKRDGRREKKALGRYPAMTLAQARTAYASEVAPALEAGKNPRVTVAANGKPTLERMLQAYVDNLKARKVASAVEVERVLLKTKGNAAEIIGRQRLAGTVEPSDVAAYLSRYFHAGHRGAADKARAYLMAAFNWAMHSANDYTATSREEWGVKSNPAMGVKRDMGARKTRERNLSVAELRALWAAADQANPNWTLETAACVRLLIVCGQRVMETLRIEGRDIDLEAKTWAMPAGKTKTRKRAHVVPLPDIAVEILRPLVARHGRGYLFPSKAAAGRHMDHPTVMQVLDRWMDTEPEGVEPFQARDIRRTWKSRTGEIGISKETRDRLQQHLQHDTSSIHYDRANYMPQMREAMDAWGKWLEDHVVLSEIAQKCAA